MRKAEVVKRGTGPGVSDPLNKTLHMEIKKARKRREEQEEQRKDKRFNPGGLTLESLMEKRQVEYKPHKCVKCERSFGEKAGLDTHTRMVHG